MLAVEDNVRIRRESSLEYYKMICSFPYQNHPIFYENKALRRAYIILLHHYAKEDVDYQRYCKPIITLYEHCFNIEEIYKEQTSQSSLKFIKKFERQDGNSKKRNFMYITTNTCFSRIICC